MRVSEAWEVFGEAVLACAREVCGMYKVGVRQVRNGSKLRADEVKLSVKDKSYICWHYLQRRSVRYTRESGRSSGGRCRG